jgi:hypothetical protein
LTEKVAPTPKSLFDCITAGEKPDRVEMRDYLMPARAGMDAVGLGGVIEFALINIESHCHAIADQRLPAHRMARGTDRDGAARCRSILQLSPERSDEISLAGTDMPMPKKAAWG